MYIYIIAQDRKNSWLRPWLYGQGKKSVQERLHPQHAQTTKFHD
jgi:hypothetical protein